MKELALEFTGIGEVRHFVFKQVKRNDVAYIYEVTQPDTDRKHYEVFLRMENTRFGTVTYPSAKAFGLYAWNCLSLEAAEKKFMQITEKKKAGAAICEI